MGSAPSFFEIVVKGWKMTLVWALSANVNTKFRLVGPWKWAGAEKVMKTEIWDTITRRRGFFGKFSPFRFGVVRECDIAEEWALISPRCRTLDVVGHANCSLWHIKRNPLYRHEVFVDFEIPLETSYS